MLNFIKKHLTGVIAVVLTATIVVLAFFAFSDEGPVTDAVDTSLNTPTTPDERQEPTNETPVYSGTIPKSSSPSEKYLFEQIICGNGDITLCSVHQTAFSTYVIAETNCKTGDVYAEKPTVGLIKLDSLGNIEKTYSVTNSCEYEYVASCLTNLGIAVVATDGKNNYLYVTVTDFDLQKTDTKIMPYADSVSLFPTEDSFLLFADNGKENFIVKYSSEELSFSTVNSGKIVDIFEFGDFYRLTYNNTTGYGITDLNKNDFSVIRELFVASATLKCIIPIVENGKQIYIAIENEGSLYARKYFSDMTVANSERKKIATADLLGQGTDGNNVYLCLSGGLNGVVTLKTDLSFSYSANRTDSVISDIADFAYGDCFYLLVHDANKNIALIKTSASSSEATYYPVGDKALLITYPNKTIGIIYQSSFYEYSAIKLIGVR
ncbi:MAG: hypothetical protein ACI4SK_01225 [Christensenellales bacterium]